MCAVELSSRCRNVESSAVRRSGLAIATIVAVRRPGVNDRRFVGRALKPMRAPAETIVMASGESASRPASAHGGSTVEDPRAAEGLMRWVGVAMFLLGSVTLLAT